MSPGAGSRRPPAFGPEVWSPVAGQDWCYWDRWFCVVAELDHDGSLDAVEEVLVAALGDRLGGSRPGRRSPARDTRRSPSA